MTKVIHIASLITIPVDGLHSTAIYLLKEDNLPIQTSKRYHVSGKKWQSYVWSIDKVVRPSDLTTEWGTLSLIVNFPRPGGGCPMVGMKIISKPVEGLHSTAIYLLKEDNLPIQTNKRKHAFGEK